MRLERIVSGGQTGADRGALDAALELGFPCGGWCPRGRTAEDGRIPGRYPLKESQGANAERTRRNVRDSQGTAVVTFGPPAGGSLLTLESCAELGRPFLRLDAEVMGPERAAELLAAFVARYDIGVLNVAGPRASEAPGAQAYVRAMIRALLAPAASSDGGAAEPPAGLGVRCGGLRA